jgi:hypothetical protein
MKRVNIGLKDETHTAAKLISIIKKVPLGRYLEEAVEQAVEKDKDLLKKMKP